MDSAAMIASAAKEAVESLSDPSSVSRPPFQSFSDTSSAQWYFVKQIVDLITPQLFKLATGDKQAWQAQAKLSRYLLGDNFTARFNEESASSPPPQPDYRSVQRLICEAVRELAEKGSELKMRAYFGDNEGEDLGGRPERSGVDSVDSPSYQRDAGCVRLVSHATAKNRGRRNEDRFLVAAFNSADLKDIGERSCANGEANFLAVLDGHGGSDGAELAASYLLPLFLAAARVDCDSDSVNSATKANGDEKATSAADRLRNVFLAADAKLAKAASLCGTAGGCTCTACIVSGDRLTVAWVGDSEAYLIHRNGQATQLTSPPHRPSEPSERARVESAGGFVMDSSPPRLNGVLAVTRSLGDRNVVGVTPEPQIVQRQLDLNPMGNDVAVVLASDGLWDAVTPGEVAAALLAMSTDSGVDGDEASAASALIDMAVAAGSTDNTTVIVAWL